MLVEELTAAFQSARAPKAPAASAEGWRKTPTAAFGPERRTTLPGSWVQSRTSSFAWSANGRATTNVAQGNPKRSGSGT